MPLISVPPAECPRGHELGPGRMIVGHLPCRCPLALEGGGNGHTTHQCEPCEAEGYRAVRYDPPHVTGHPTASTAYPRR